MRKTPDRIILVALLLAFGALLLVTIVQGVFIIDEDNYLVTVVGLRHGQLTVPGTENLTPSRELVYFDPEASRRVVTATPVVSLVPPLYAFLVYPFSFGGWRGLVLLNIISFLVCIYLVFRYTQELAQHRLTPWIASCTFAIGGYCIEYAQGMWPQMLSVALCLGALYLGLRARRNGTASKALIAGVLIGTAIGVREQDIFLAGCVGFGLILSGPRKLRTASMFALGVITMLVIMATINYYRLGTWLPFPKVVGYANVVAANAESTSIWEPFRVFWSKVVDYSSYGPNTDHIKSGFYQWDAASGTVLLNGIVRKSWIQSSPWVALSLVVMLVSIFKQQIQSVQVTHEIRLLTLVVLPTLLMFVAAGFNRTDGLSFNQRYFLELLPLAAIALGLYIDGLEIRILPVTAGVFIGMLVVVTVLVLPSSVQQHFGQRFVPVFLALFLVVTFYFSRNHRTFFILLGICIGWGFFIHLESDLVGSRFRREINASRFNQLGTILPDHSALFTYWGNKDAAGPLQLKKDIVILDVWADEGQDAHTLESELSAARRRIFVLKNDMPENIIGSLTERRRVEDHSAGQLKIVEVLNDSAMVPSH